MTVLLRRGSSEVVLVDVFLPSFEEIEAVRYGLFLLSLFDAGDGGILTGLTAEPGLNVEPGPVSCEGSGAFRGSSRYSEAFRGGRQRSYLVLSIACGLPNSYCRNPC